MIYFPKEIIHPKDREKVGIGVWKGLTMYCQSNRKTEKAYYPEERLGTGNTITEDTTERLLFAITTSNTTDFHTGNSTSGSCAVLKHWLDTNEADQDNYM